MSASSSTVLSKDVLVKLSSSIGIRVGVNATTDDYCMKNIDVVQIPCWNHSRWMLISEAKKLNVLWTSSSANASNAAVVIRSWKLPTGMVNNELMAEVQTTLRECVYFQPGVSLLQLKTKLWSLAPIDVDEILSGLIRNGLMDCVKGRYYTKIVHR